MSPQEWIESTKRRWDSGHLYEGAQHLAAALEEIARLQAQLSQAERVVVPECGYRFNTYCMCSVPSSRVLKEGEVAVEREEWEAAREWEFDGTRICKIEFDGGFRFCVKRGDHLILGRSGEWGLDRRPSSRDEEFFREFRFDTFGSAIDALRTQEGGA